MIKAGNEERDVKSMEGEESERGGSHREVIAIERWNGRDLREC